MAKTIVTVDQGGTGAETLTDGGVLLGSGVGAVTATAVLADGEMLVGDGTTDPALESGATLRTSIGVDAAGTDNSTNVTLASVTGNYLALSGQEVTAGTVPLTLGGTGSTTASAALTALGAAPSAFTQTGTGAVATTVDAKLKEVVSVMDFGATGLGVADDSAAIQAAIDSVTAAHVYVPTGTYRVDTMLEIDTNRTLELAGGAKLQRGGSSTDPVIWMKGIQSTIMGAGQGTSVIESTNNSPNGVVLVGQWSMSVSPVNVMYNTIRNVMIAGSTAYGQTSGDPDVCLLIQAPELVAPYSPADQTVYFTNISGVLVQKANYGIWLKGYANGNTISDIQGYKLGDDNLGDGALFYDNGSLDNAICNSFFHLSPDSVTIKMEKLDNTSTSGGVEHTTMYSSYTNICTEPNGTNAKGIMATDASVNKCFFNIRPNVNQGDIVDSAFRTRNTLIGSQSVNEIAAEAVLTPKKFAWLNDDDTSAKAFERAWKLTGLTENTQYKLLTVDTDDASANQLVEISIADAWGSGITPKQAERAVFAIRRDASSTITVDVLEHSKIDSTHAVLGGLTVPTIDGDDVVFTWKARNNGTATTNQYVVVKATVLGGSDDVVYHQTATVSTSTAASVPMVTARLDVAQTFTAGQRGEVTTLSDGANIATDLALSNNFKVTLAGNRVLDNPSNLVAGQSGVIVITQDGTGSRTLDVSASYWQFEGGTEPTFSTAAAAVDTLVYYVASASSIQAVLLKDLK